MKKSILNLNGALELSKKEQKTINGGKQFCGPVIGPDGEVYPTCPPGTCCRNNVCVAC
jgi:hypothetical protein